MKGERGAKHAFSSLRLMKTAMHFPQWLMRSHSAVENCPFGLIRALGRLIVHILWGADKENIHGIRNNGCPAWQHCLDQLATLNSYLILKWM